jgi:RHS repeat-associated protein
MKKILYILSFIPVLALAQSQDQNYVKTTTYKVATTIVTSPTDAQKVQNVTYYDGLGRPIQQVAHKQSDTGKDIVTPVDYDGFGRQVKEYLPYVPTTAASQEYKASALTDILNFPDYLGQSPFSEKELENSPLNRVLKQAAPGNVDSWAKGSGHEIKFDYQTNTADDEVLLFNITANWEPTNGLYDIPTTLKGESYEENQLYKTITFDENTEAEPSEVDGSTVEFKDKEGRVVLKRTYENKERHDTYYIYDQYGNLTFVTPPLVDTSGTISNDVLNNLCYQYKYDYRNRLVEKKLPGKQCEFIVYDKLDRVVATGPALTPFNDSALVGTVGWMITKYDVFNRPVYTAWEQSTTVTPAGRFAKQNTINGLASFNESKTAISNSVGGVTNIKYTNDVNPTSFHLLSVNYYDNYDFTGAPTTFDDVLTQPVYYNNITKPRGLPTGSWTRALQSSGNTSGETSYVLYDYKARPIRTYKTNHLGGFTEALTQLDFTGKPLLKVTNHKRSVAGIAGSNANLPVTTTEKFTYSDQDRLTKHTMQVNSETIQVLSEPQYDELGQMITKYVGGKEGEARLQKVDYNYNIRGWLTDINNIVNLNNTPFPVDLFSFQIVYETPDDIDKALYNGNISEVYWRSNGDNIKRKYVFDYDNLNRLTNAEYIKPDAATPNTNAYNESMNYDKNGNITNLYRNGGQDLAYNDPLEIDNLTYKYDANDNQLKGVHDNSNSLQGFKDKSGSTLNDVDYTYDANGNMLTDANKGITSIKYNHLNLPTEIVFDNNNSKKINYLYNAIGVKLQKIFTDGPSVVITDYLDGFQHKAQVLEFFPHAEGYVTNTQTIKNDGTRRDNFNYVFNYLDHLGNIRLSYAWDYDLNVLKIIEENNYYPFGLKHTNYNSDLRGHKAVLNETKVELRAIPGGGGNTAESAMYKYKYNGKELQDELGLNWTAMDYRNYDMALARFVNPDPMSEQAHSMSPYRFGFNSPTLFSDPTGLWEEIAGGWSTNDSGEIAAFMSTLNSHSDKKGNKKKLDIYVNNDKNDKVLGASYKEVVKTEKVLTALFGYSTLKTIDLPGNNGKYDWDDLASNLEGLKSNGYSFGSFIFDSHGSYWDTKFYIGSDEVNPSNYKSTSGLSPYLQGTSVYIMACHAGGGESPQVSKNFTQGLSNLWGATVYTNRSWSPSSIFNTNLKVSEVNKEKPNATKWSGQWLRATPGQKTPSVITNLILHSHTSSTSGVYNTHN